MSNKDRWALAVAVLLGVGGVGATITDYVNPELGWTLMVVGVLGSLGILAWGRLPRVRSWLAALRLSWPGRWTSSGLTWKTSRPSLGEAHGLILRVRSETALQPIAVRVRLVRTAEVESCLWALERQGDPAMPRIPPVLFSEHIRIRGRFICLAVSEPAWSPDKVLVFRVVTDVPIDVAVVERRA